VHLLKNIKLQTTHKARQSLGGTSSSGCIQKIKKTIFVIQQLSIGKYH